MNLGREPRSDNKLHSLYFRLPLQWVKSQEKKYQNYFCVTAITTNNMQYGEISPKFDEEIDTERSTRRSDGF